MSPSKDYDRVREHEHQRAWIAVTLAQLQSSRFYGAITIKFEDGIVKRIVNEQSMTPPPVGAPLVSRAVTTGS